MREYKKCNSGEMTLMMIFVFLFFPVVVAFSNNATMQDIAARVKVHMYIVRRDDPITEFSRILLRSG